MDKPTGMDPSSCTHARRTCVYIGNIGTCTRASAHAGASVKVHPHWLVSFNMHRPLHPWLWHGIQLHSIHHHPDVYSMMSPVDTPKTSKTPLNTLKQPCSETFDSKRGPDTVHWLISPSRSLSLRSMSYGPMVNKAGSEFGWEFGREFWNLSPSLLLSLSLLLSFSFSLSLSFSLPLSPSLPRSLSLSPPLSPSLHHPLCAIMCYLSLKNTRRSAWSHADHAKFMQFWRWKILKNCGVWPMAYHG